MKTSVPLGSEKVITLFHRAYKTCPAYHDFIDSHDLDPTSIKTHEDIVNIPVMDKDNYLRKYSLEEKIIDNKLLSDFYMITASSGSTGHPTFWPRDYVIDTMLEQKKEELYEEHFQISQKKTLVIITFALGMWTAGMLTAKLTWAAAQNNNLSVICTGMNRENILQSLQTFNDQYDQIIIVGYPPFLINVIQYCETENFNFLTEKIHFLYTAESLSLNARKFLAAKISGLQSFKKVVGFYACSEAGIIAAETPGLADLAERSYTETEFNSKLFGSMIPATLFAYNPLNKYIEELEGELLITSDQPVPLIRYNIHDRGALRTKAQLQELCKQFSIDYSDIELPENSVFVHGRSNSVVMTANIYVEDVKYCLDHSQFSSRLSGLFRFGTVEVENFKKQLKIVVYLKPGLDLNNEEREIFLQEFSNNLFSVNSDLSALRGNEEYLSSIAPIEITFSPENEYDLTSIKLKYFL